MWSTLFSHDKVYSDQADEYMGLCLLSHNIIICGSTWEFGALTDPKNYWLLDSGISSEVLGTIFSKKNNNIGLCLYTELCMSKLKRKRKNLWIENQFWSMPDLKSENKVLLHSRPDWHIQIKCTQQLGTPPKKITGFFGNFSQMSDPPPLPPFRNPSFKKQKSGDLFKK